MSKSLSYQEAMDRITEIVATIEQDDIGIDELSALVKEATALINSCQLKLQQTEEEIQISMDSLNNND